MPLPDELDQYKFKVIHEEQWGNERINRFEIFISKHDSNKKTVENYYSFIRLKLEGEEAVLKKIQQKNREGIVSIHPSVFESKKEKLSEIIISEASEKEWLCYKSTKISFWEGRWPALICGIFGLFIDSTFAIGKVKASFVVFHLSDFWTLFWMSVSILFKTVALILLAKKSLKEAK